jgi:Arc/MetJ-type ribon-helix-helix transcriptional regulator
MTIQLELSPHQKAYVESEMRSGHFRTEEEVLSVAIDRMAERKLQELRELIQEAWDESEREEGIEITGAEILAKLRAGK